MSNQKDPYHNRQIVKKRYQYMKEVAQHNKRMTKTITGDLDE